MIPAEFLTRMREMPELDHAAFEAALERPAVRGLRVNTLKTDAAHLLPLLPFSVEPLPFCENAYYAPEDKVGALAAHHAGMIYMQDPGAISTVAAAAPKSGITVLDMCAAPGGKSTQLAAAIAPDGVLVANEYVASRCRILQGNVERLGCRSTIVTNLDSGLLADFYGTYFDLVVADIPCSGEGMLRKYEVAGEEWSPENVAACAVRGREILENAAACVRPGGRLLFSTCTFALEENEQNVDAFLTDHPEISLCAVPPAILNITANGVNFAGCAHDMRACRRFYPHLSPGEGQFIALLEKSPDAAATAPRADAARPLGKKEAETVRVFLKETLRTPPSGRLLQLRDDVYLCPDAPVPPHGVFAPGVCLGTLQKGRLVPHHHFFSALGQELCLQLPLSDGDARVGAFLRGEEIDAPELTKNGFACVLYEGAPLGGGKAVGGRLKNHYPKGLRNRS